VRPGDLVSRITASPSRAGTFRRYERLVATADQIAFTFIDGTRETERVLHVAELVP
jgi:hypothetical protein